MQPFLAPIALVAASLEFRLIAYRMTHVTARPYPTPADGIEMWQRLLNLVVVMSALVNAGLAVFSGCMPGGQLRIISAEDPTLGLRMQNSELCEADPGHVLGRLPRSDFGLCVLPPQATS